MKCLLICTNLPDITSAKLLAQKIIHMRLAACVTMLGSAQSIYHWQGEIVEATEVPLLIKTTHSCYRELAAVIRSLHPYEVPEIIALEIVEGDPTYLEWIRTETLPSTSALSV